MEFSPTDHFSDVIIDPVLFRRSYYLDVDCVTNEQFQDFIRYDDALRWEDSAYPFHFVKLIVGLFA